MYIRFQERLLTPCGIFHFNLFIFLFRCLFLLHLFFPHFLPMFLTHLHPSYPLHIPLFLLPSLPLPLSTIWCSKHTTRQTNTERDRDKGYDESVPAYFRATDRRARVAIANMRACHARPKLLLNIKNVTRQDALNSSL